MSSTKIEFVWLPFSRPLNQKVVIVFAPMLAVFDYDVDDFLNNTDSFLVLWVDFFKNEKKAIEVP